MSVKLEKIAKKTVINEGESNEKTEHFDVYLFPKDTVDADVIAGCEGMFKRNSVADVDLWDAINRIVTTTVRNRVRMVATQDQSTMAKAKRIAKGDQKDAFQAELDALVARYQS